MYVDKYGKDRVVQIVTFGTMAAACCYQGMSARVLDLPYAMVDSIAKMVPREIGIYELIKQLTNESGFAGMRTESDEQVRDLIDKSKRLEGLPRHASMHAAGVFNQPESRLMNMYHCQCGSDGSVVAQFVMTTLEELGLLKMDFLGLRTLTVIHDAEELIRKHTSGIFRLKRLDYSR